MLPFAFSVTTVKLSFKHSPNRHQSLTMTNGEQMFLACQSGSFLLDVWAPGPRVWVTVPLESHGQAPGPALGSEGVRTWGRAPRTRLDNSGLSAALGVRLCSPMRN